ncbi:cytochrome c [Ferruginivarius sediminum]|nr:cytochrome c [Ferruginivarius sediminum]
MGIFRSTAGTLLALALAVAAAHAGAAEPVGPKLPPKVRGLLLQEMNAVLAASHEIQDAIIQGQDGVVAEKAQAIYDSFILDQQMTDEDRQALRAAVPEAFVKRDQAFHELTGRLAQAARDGDGARQRELFGDMIEACAACHARYATNRFPAFTAE